MTKKHDNLEYIPEEQTDNIENKLKKIKHQLKHCQKECAEYLAGWQRAKADYINLEKRIHQEKSEWVKFANAELILRFLPILDSLDLAIRRAEQLNEKPATAKMQNLQPPKRKNFAESAVLRKSLTEGIKQVRDQLMDMLKSHGLEPIKSLGEKFNPELHEAIEEIKGKKGIIIEELQKGYTLNKKLIRPSKVKVGK